MAGLRRFLPAGLAILGVVLLIAIVVHYNNRTVDIPAAEIVIESKCPELPTEVNWKTIDFNTLSPQQVVDYLYWTNRSSCKLAHDFGGKMMNNPSGFDGQKAVCLDPGVRPEGGKCLIYSFGINNEWSFDDTMEKYGCEVFAFDPSMNQPDQDRTEKIHFFNVGLGDKDYTTQKGWKIKSLSSIYQMLLPRHGEKVIDYLKMDIESAEWDTIPQIIKSGMLTKVRQLGVEFHFHDGGNLQRYRDLISIIKSIEDAGMIRFDSKYNPWWKGKIVALDYQGSLGFEIAFYQVINP